MGPNRTELSLHCLARGVLATLAGWQLQVKQRAQIIRWEFMLGDAAEFPIAAAGKSRRGSNGQDPEKLGEILAGEKPNIARLEAPVGEADQGNPIWEL
jgi:hypothetical protein